MSEDNKEQPAADADDWGSALAEQAQSTAPPPRHAASSARTSRRPSTAAGERVFQPLQGNTAFEIARGDIDRVLDVPVQLTTELGRTRITIKSLLQLSQGSVVELDGLAGQPWTSSSTAI
jgi:flagellar motor switch protein FliN/FliY